MKTLTSWATAVIAIFAPIHTAAIVAIVLVAFDLFTGVLAAWKRGEPITSSKLKTTVIKLFVYEVAILLGFLTQTYLTGSVLPVCSLVTSVVGLTEMKSVLENLDSLSGGSLFKTLVEKVSKSKETLEP